MTGFVKVALSVTLATSGASALRIQGMTQIKQDFVKRYSVMVGMTWQKCKKDLENLAGVLVTGDEEKTLEQIFYAKEGLPSQDEVQEEAQRYKLDEKEVEEGVKALKPSRMLEMWERNVPNYAHAGKKTWTDCVKDMVIPAEYENYLKTLFVAQGFLHQKKSKMSLEAYYQKNEDAREAFHELKDFERAVKAEQCYCKLVTKKTLLVAAFGEVMSFPLPNPAQVHVLGVSSKPAVTAVVKMLKKLESHCRKGWTIANSYGERQGGRELKFWTQTRNSIRKHRKMLDSKILLSSWAQADVDSLHEGIKTLIESVKQNKQKTLERKRWGMGIFSRR